MIAKILKKKYNEWFKIYATNKLQVSHTVQSCAKFMSISKYNVHIYKEEFWFKEREPVLAHYAWVIISEAG